jgi:hypothetical protein
VRSVSPPVAAMVHHVRAIIGAIPASLPRAAQRTLLASATRCRASLIISPGSLMRKKPARPLRTASVRAAGSSKAVTKPELAGTYLNLRAAELAKSPERPSGSTAVRRAPSRTTSSVGSPHSRCDCARGARVESSRSLIADDVVPMPRYKYNVGCLNSRLASRANDLTISIRR